MDGERFDQWTLGWGERRSRRGFGVVALGAVAAFGAAGVGEAKKKKKKKKKPSGTCIEIAQACSGSGCCPGLECKLVFNSSVPSGPNCCRSAGSCRFAADCCRGTYCGGGECLTCKGEGEECLSGQCCPGFFCSILIPTEPGTCISSD